MIKDMTTPELKQALLSLMEAKGANQTDVGKAIGRSPAVISAFLKGTYNGNLEDLETRLRGFLEKSKAREYATPRSVPFIKTYNGSAFEEIADRCLLENEMGVCTGDAGAGKTMAFTEYATRHPEAIAVFANLGFTARVLFAHLCDCLDLSKKGNVFELYERVVGKLKGSGRLIMVDQAEYLPYRALELLRSVYDEAAVGILLVGMPRLYHNLKQDKGDFAQLYSRVAVYRKLNFSLRDSEAKAIIESRLPNIKADTQLMFELCKGNARTLDKLIRGAKWIAHNNKVEIDADVVKQAASILMG